MSVCRTSATIIQATIPSTTTATADPSQRYWSRSSPVEHRDRATMPTRATTSPASYLSLMTEGQS